MKKLHAKKNEEREIQEFDDEASIVETFISTLFSQPLLKNLSRMFVAHFFGAHRLKLPL